MRELGALAFLPALAMTLGAQQPRYQFAARDTVRYQEITESRIELRPPRGPVAITSSHDAKIAASAERGDTIRAWYESLVLSSVGPQGESRPSTDAALRLPFRLVITPSGHVSTAAAPLFPAEVASITDLTRQFEDFFIALPSSALRPEAIWADTVTNSTVVSSPDSFESRHIRRYRVLRDTLVAGGIVAVLIAVEQEIAFHYRSPMKNAPVVIDTRLEGHETGTAVFAAASGRMLSRVRRGQLSGAQVLRGEGREMTVPMTYDYSSTLSAR